MAQTPLAYGCLAAGRRRALRLLQARRDRGAALERLGPYSSLAQAHYPLGSTARWGVKHLAELGLVVGLVPMSSLIVLLWLGLRGAPTHPGGTCLPGRRPGGVPLGSRRDGCLRGNDDACALRALHVLPRASAAARVRGVADPRAPEASSRHRRRARRAPGSAAEPHACANRLAGRGQRRHAGRALSVLGTSPGWNPRAKGLDRHRRGAWSLLFAICARSIARIALPYSLAAYLGVAGTSIIDNTRKSDGRAIAGPDPSWVQDAVGRNQPVVLVNTPELGPDASVLMLETEFWNPEREARVLRRGGRHLRVARNADDARYATGHIAPLAPKGVRYALVASRGPISRAAGRVRGRQFRARPLSHRPRPPHRHDHGRRRLRRLDGLTGAVLGVRLAG